MKKLLLVLTLTLLTVFAHARKFYFSSSGGNDSYTVTQAQNQATPWKTLVNLHKFANGSSPFGAAPNRAAAGDTFLFKCGDVFDTGWGNSNDDFGVVKWWNGVAGYTAPTGTAANPIVFTSYGSGSLPNLLFPFPTSIIGRNRNVLTFKNVNYMYFDKLQFNDIRFPYTDKVTSAYTTTGLFIGESNASICGNIKVTNCNFSNTCYGIRSCARVMEISNNTFTNLMGYKSSIKDVFASKVKTGISLEIPEGYYGLILDRSSMGSKLIKTLGGVIDCGYRGDVTVCLMNLSFFSYVVKAGDKIAQIVINKVEFDDIEEVEELAESERGEKGFGSSGQ
jgi:dUTP pyrophosphatase